MSDTVNITDNDLLCDLIEDSGNVEVDYGRYRHGYAVRYYVRYLDSDWLTEYIRYSTNEGMEWNGSVRLFPAKKVLKEVWVRA